MKKINENQLNFVLDQLEFPMNHWHKLSAFSKNGHLYVLRHYRNIGPEKRTVEEFAGYLKQRYPETLEQFLGLVENCPTLQRKLFFISGDGLTGIIGEKLVVDP